MGNERLWLRWKVRNLESRMDADPPLRTEAWRELLEIERAAVGTKIGEDLSAWIDANLPKWQLDKLCDGHDLLYMVGKARNEAKNPRRN